MQVFLFFIRLLMKLPSITMTWSKAEVKIHKKEKFLPARLKKFMS